MADFRLDPPRSMPTYAVRAPLVRWLREQAEDAERAISDYRMLDVGCGAKPYEPLFGADPTTLRPPTTGGGRTPGSRSSSP
jgi:hypothetical protein